LNGVAITEELKAKAFEGIWDIGTSTIYLEKSNRCKAAFIHSHKRVIGSIIIGLKCRWSTD